MKSKLKKIIIVVVVLFVVAAGVLLGFSLLSKMSTTTIYDLKLIDVETNEKIFEKDVYLTAEEKNNFDVKLYVSASSLTNYVVSSSDPSVARVTYSKGFYKINYLKEGTAIITATTLEASNIQDSFILNVKQYIPTAFSIIDSPTAEAVLGEKEVSIFADDIDYYFNFSSSNGTLSENMNLSSLRVVNDYNKDVFENIYIDAQNSRLVINAKQSSQDSREYVTLQSTGVDESGNKIVVETFTICVNVKGNYICDMQIVLFDSPEFDNAKYVWGAGILNEGEQKVDKIVLTNHINKLYVQVRVVYTNGEMVDVTEHVVSTSSSTSINTFMPYIGRNYYQITSSQHGTVTFAYLDKNVEMQILYINEETMPVDYNKFINKDLYKKVESDGKTYFEYKYWDERFKRTDAIIDKDGNIIAFYNGNPDCE